MAEPVIEVPAAGDRLRQARERRHHGGVVERRLAGILEFAAPFHVERHLAGQTSTGEPSVLAAATAVAMLQQPGPPIPSAAPKLPPARA